jgi:integrase
VAIYKRGGKWWLRYTIPKKLAGQFGIPTKVREPTGTGVKGEAEDQDKLRRREAKDGTWRPRGTAGAGSKVETYAKSWTARRQRLGVREADRDEERLRPLLRGGLGNMAMGEVKRLHVKQAVDRMREARGHTGKAKGKPYSPTTIYRAYAVLRAMFREAEQDEVVAKNPCTLSARDNSLPKRDKAADDEWRSGAIFTRPEIRALISDERVPPLRQMLYALTFFCGLRMGEAVARTWGDYDPSAKPLGRLLVATQHEGRKLKTDVPRKAPVHPELAAMLERWRAGYEDRYREAPAAERLILRTRYGGLIGASGILGNLRGDLERLEMRPRRFHDLRRSLVTVARECGARAELLAHVTHGRQPGIMELYTSPSWATLCEQISCIRLEEAH